MKTCLCGCGEPVAPGRTYRQGHVARTAAFKAAVYEPRRPKVDPPNPSGLCLCGCGQPTPIAKVTRPRLGYLKGHPTRYAHGHTSVGKGAAHHLWKGGRTIRDGYVLLLMPEHPSANSGGYVPEHRVVWERTHGRLLARNEHVHHINGVRDDNRPENLVAMTNAEHKALHGSEHGQRSAAVKKGLIPSTTRRACVVCGEEYLAGHTFQRFCSRKCYGVSKRRPMK